MLTVYRLSYTRNMRLEIERVAVYGPLETLGGHMRRLMSFVACAEVECRDFKFLRTRCPPLYQTCEAAVFGALGSKDNKKKNEEWWALV